FSGGPDVTNLGNLNVHYAFPIFSKPGRGMPFNYALSFDSSVWYPSSNAWTPVTNWGWRGPSDALAGVVGFKNIRLSCIDPDAGFRIFYFAHLYGPYTDGFGVTHPVSASQVDDSACGPGSSESGVATDGSGYTLAPGLLVRSRSGQVINTTA